MSANNPNNRRLRKSSSKRIGADKKLLIIVCILLLVLVSLIVYAVLTEKWSFKWSLPSSEKIVSEKGSVNIVFCPTCEQEMLSLIDGGGEIYCALYDFGPTMASHLQAQGVQVITDEEDGGTYGKPFVHYALMHHKFCIINSSTVTTGSYNPTEDGEENRNNFVIIQSSTLANNYLLEYESLDSYSKRAKIVHSVVLDDGKENISVQNYFCPQDKCEEALIREIDSANVSIKYLVFSFTSDAVANAIVRAKNRGVYVQGICDSSQWNVKGGECERLGALKWTRPGILHHKVFIIDSEIVTTGSYNPTANGATRNRENFVIIGSKSIASRFLLEYEDALSVVN